MQASGQKQDDMQKPLFENKNAMAICTRNSKKAMKIGPQEKRFCFSRGPIFMHNFFKAILQRTHFDFLINPNDVHHKSLQRIPYVLLF